ncbi:RHS repeat-associated core domain-containing protein [Veillonella parvula]|uniref:RHS repeat-associated core domain-containing protein n=1 Tax=Veillonella parvula TaxID=29466 RepID=UPI0039B02F02
MTGSYTGWGRLKEKIKVTDRDHQSFCLQNQYADLETGLHYNFFRYYEPDAGRFVNQDLIGLEEGFNVYQFAPNAQDWVDPLGLSKCSSRSKTPNPYQGVKEASQSNQNGTS